MGAFSTDKIPALIKIIASCFSLTLEKNVFPQSILNISKQVLNTNCYLNLTGLVLDSHKPPSYFLREATNYRTDACTRGLGASID